MVHVWRIPRHFTESPMQFIASPGSIPVDGGIIVTGRDQHGNRAFQGISHHESKTITCYAKSAVEYFLWAIDARVLARKYRTGH